MSEEFEACGSFVRTKRAPDGSGGLLVAECAHSNGFGEQTAQLFAAAPAMLAALKEIAGYATPVEQELNAASAAKGANDEQ